MNKTPLIPGEIRNEARASLSPARASLLPSPPELLDSILDASPSVIVALDERRRVRLINRRGCQALQIDAAQALGRDWLEIFVPADLRAKAEQFLGALPDRESPQGRMEYSLFDAQGRERILAWRCVPLCSPGGKPSGALLMGEEVTEIRRLEHMVLEIREAEQRRIGQDLHDGLGQNLTAVTYLAQLLQKKLAEEGSREEARAGEIVRMIRQSIDHVRGLARGLYPVELSDHGLPPALLSLAKMTEEQCGVRCRLLSDETITLDHETSIQFYRIAQEAIHNAVKHAQARNITIHLHAFRGNILLSVSDDGIGLDSGRREAGMGLNIMRFRANAIGGHILFSSARGRGTRVTCRVKRGPRS